MKRVVLFLAAVFLPAVCLNAANITWVSFHPGDDTPSSAAAAAGFTQAPDVGYTQLLEANGHNVSRYVTTGSPDTGLLNASDLVIISRSVPSSDYQDDPETLAWNGITAPTMIINGYILRNSRLGFTNGGTMVDTNQTVSLNVLDPSHPIFSDIALDGGNNMVNPYANIVSFNGTDQRGISVNTDPIAGGGTVLATIGTAADPTFGGMVIAEYAAGSVLSTGDTLGGKRLIMLTGSREQGITSEGAGIYDLDTDGAQIFLNAVEYMAVPEPTSVGLLSLGALALLFARRKR